MHQSPFSLIDATQQDDVRLRGKFAPEPVKDAVKLAAELATLKDYFRAELGIPIVDDPVSLGLYVVDGPLPQRLTTLARAWAVSLWQPQTMLVRNVFREVAAVSKLGDKYEMLTRGADAIEGDGLGWSRNEIELRLAYGFKTDIGNGRSVLEGRAAALKLARELDEQMSLEDAWALVRSATGVRTG